MKRINYLQIILHFIATCFFIFSFQFYSAIYNIRILKLISENGVENVLKNAEDYGITIIDMWNFNFTAFISSLIAIIVVFIISILISVKRKWSVWNSLIVLILSFFLSHFDFFGLYTIKKYFSPGYFIDDLLISFLTSGSFFLAIGFVILFSKYLNRLIENQRYNLIKN